MIEKDWAMTEFEDVNLGDKRLNKRLVKIAGQFISSTESPINKACEGWSDTKSAYRFFQNDRVDYKKIINQHSIKTRDRCKYEEVILALQDTTYFNYTSHPKTTGLGILSKFTGKYKKEILTKGLYMHATLAINIDGLPLGILDQKISAREVLSNEEIAIKKPSHNNSLPIEEKESIRWLDSMRESALIFKDTDTKVVTIADREADIYDLFLLAHELDASYLIRASHNRKVNKSAIHSESSGDMLFDFMEMQEIKGKIEVNIPAKKEQPKRVAICNIKYGKIKVLPPRNYNGKKLTNMELTLYTIQVVEKNPPNGDERIEWILYTNIPVLNYKDAIEKIRWYCLRWRIEVYFKIIKSGFNVEDCRLETADRLIRYLAVISIVSWRVFWLTMVHRTSPDNPVSEFMSEKEWKILFLTFNPNNNIPKQSPSLKNITIWLARLGGFLARTRDGSPGITHIWRGLKKLSDIVKGMHLYQSICG